MYKDYCCIDCFRLDGNEAPNDKKKKRADTVIVDFTCAYCGKIFKKNASLCTKYCSDECRKNGSVSQEKLGRFLILERDDFSCFYCGKKSYRDGAELHVDHVIPRHLGGKSSPNNLVTACKECNLQKGSKIIKDVNILLNEINLRNSNKGISPNIHIKLNNDDK